MADKYDPIRLVGKGSFGSVYLVRRRRDGAHFVLKNMQIRNVPEKELQSYQNEVRLLTELEHPGIVSHIESFIDGDKQHMCIVMGYCEGGDLAAFLKHKKGVPMRESEVLYHFVQMALALLFMHEKNILHRDLKTQNIFIKNGLIQLGDFGISKALTGSHDFAQTCIGTPYYMSPELFQNKPYNHKSDVWALGCVLYEMMTYKHAFDANSINGLAQKILKGQIQQLPQTYPKSLRSLVRSMLDLDPRGRPSISSILSMPFLRKHIRTYVTAILMNPSQYRSQDLENFKAQIRRLDMADMLEMGTPNSLAQPSQPQLQGIPALQLPTQTSASGDRVSARPSARRSQHDSSAAAPTPAPVPSAARPLISASSAAAARLRERDREQAARLALLAEQDSQRRSLEEKLARLKKAHEAKEKSLVEQRRAKLAAAQSSAAAGQPPSSSRSVALRKERGMAPSASKAHLKKPATSASRRPSSAQQNGASSSSSRPSSSNVSAQPPPPASAAPPSSVPPRRSSHALAVEARLKRLERERREHEQLLQLKELEEMRAADRARKAEEERMELRRKAAAARRAAQAQAQQQQAAEEAAAKEREREKELEKAREQERERQRLARQAQVEAEKAELERISLEQKWINKRLDELTQQQQQQHQSSVAGAMSKNPSTSGVPASRARNLREDSSEAPLAPTAKNRATAPTRPVAAAAQTRKEKEKEAATAPAPTPSTRPTHADDEVEDVLEGEDELDEEVDSSDAEADLVAEAAIIQESETLLLGLTRRIQDLRTSIQVSNVLQHAREGERAAAGSRGSTGKGIAADKASAAASDTAPKQTEGTAPTKSPAAHATPGAHDNDDEGYPFDDDDDYEYDDDLEYDDDAADDHDHAPGAGAVGPYVVSSSPVAPTSSPLPSGNGGLAPPASSVARASTPEISENLLERMKNLAKECAKLVGRNKFIQAFEYLKAHWADSRQQHIQELTKILGPEKVKHWEMIEQLIFMEKSM